MQKKLTARVQKLSKKLPQSARSFSSTLVVEPDNQEALEKRGTLYAVFDILGESPLDPLLVTKIIHDVLHDSYYSSDTASPIQSLERAIVQVKDKVTALPTASSGGTLDFNILAAALWGNVLYMVQFGKGGSFLVRENEVKPVNTATEGNFSEASGVVRGGDVVILGTQTFVEKYSPNDLVTGAVSFSVSELPGRASAQLIKFEATAEFTEEERIDFGLSAPPIAEPELAKEPVKEKEVVQPKVSTLSIAKTVPKKLPKISLKSTKRRRIKPIYLTIGVVLILLGTSIYWTVKTRGGEEGIMQEEESAMEVPTEEEQEVPKEVDTSRDSEFKINRVEPEVFYDIKIVDESASPSDMALLASSVVVVDKNSGKIFTSSITTPKFSEEEGAFSGIDSISYFAGNLVFTDSEGFKTYSSGEATESYLDDGLGPSSAYLSFVYSVAGDKITKYQKEGDVLSGTLWIQSEELNGAVSMAIDGNIYILKSDGTLLSYYVGEKENFEITGLDKGFLNPVKLVKDIDLENIYVADAGNNRVVVLDDTGSLVKQFVASNDSWDDIRGIGVTRDEETLFVLSGSRVYSTPL